MKKIYTFLTALCLLASFHALSADNENSDKKRSSEDNKPTQEEVEPYTELDNSDIPTGKVKKDPSVFWQDSLLNQGRSEIREAHSKS